MDQVLLRERNGWREKFKNSITISLFIKRVFCLHDYEKVNEFTVPLEIDNVKELGLKPYTNLSAVRKYVTDYICKKYGKFFRKVISTDKF